MLCYCLRASDLSLEMSSFRPYSKQFGGKKRDTDAKKCQQDYRKASHTAAILKPFSPKNMAGKSPGLSLSLSLLREADRSWEKFICEWIKGYESHRYSCFISGHAKVTCSLLHLSLQHSNLPLEATPAKELQEMGFFGRGATHTSLRHNVHNVQPWHYEDVELVSLE